MRRLLPAHRVWECRRRFFDFQLNHCLLVAKISEPQDMFTEIQFWQMVDELDWPRSADQKHRVKVQVAFLKKHAKEVIAEFDRQVVEKTCRVAEAISAYEAESGESAGASDDGFHDLCCHLVGLGRKEYERALLNPKLGVLRGKQGDYQENFGYVISGLDDLENALAPQTYVNRALGEVPKLRNLALRSTSPANNQLLSSLHEFLASVANGNFDVRPWTQNPDYYQEIYAITNSYSLPNLVHDLVLYGPFLRGRFQSRALAPLTLPNRRKAITTLNHHLQKQWDRPEVRDEILRNGFVPFVRRSNQELQQALQRARMTP